MKYAKEQPEQEAGNKGKSVSGEARPQKEASILKDPNYRRSCLCILLPMVFLFGLTFFIGSLSVAQQCKEVLLKGKFEQKIPSPKQNACEDPCRPPETKLLPHGIIVKTSNMETRPLWGSPQKADPSKSLFAVVVGIKQKENVDKMIRKFLSTKFVVMLFHYDGIVHEWNDLGWSNRVIHISALNQTKWWFAKRFLHPDVVAEYDYVFLWDEDIGVENFNPERYLSIVKDEGLEISQPAHDISKSEVHHQITARMSKAKLHRRIYKPVSSGNGCDEKSSTPRCTGWIEVMAPVFSRASWRCVWHMIQNDLIHAWGLDLQLGYCAQGDRTKNIGVVDAEYIVHYGYLTLGEPENNTNSAAEEGTNPTLKNSVLRKPVFSHSNGVNFRVEVRRQSFREYKVFTKRWTKASNEDKCWIDPYPEPVKEITL